MPVDQASAFEQTLARIRERYALYFYLPDGVSPAEASSVEVELSDAARRRYPRAEVRYRRLYLAPNGGMKWNMVKAADQKAGSRRYEDG